MLPLLASLPKVLASLFRRDVRPFGIVAAPPIILTVVA
jgi:hypothetical protein